MKSVRVSLYVLLAFALTGCASNLANVRTFATSLRTATQDTTSIAAADEQACASDAALQNEYSSLEAAFKGGTLPPPPCSRLHAALKSMVAENKALGAYASALKSVAANQFATTTTDSGDVSATLKSFKVSAPVISAVGAVFSTIETAVLDGYRQREIGKVMNAPTGKALKTIIRSYSKLASQYAKLLKHWRDNIGLISNGIAHSHIKTEPVAVAELQLRLTKLQQSLKAKRSAVIAFATAIGKLKPAYDAAAKDLRHPSPTEIYADVKSFASQVKDAHDKLVAAFGHT